MRKRARNHKLLGEFRNHAVNAEKDKNSVWYYKKWYKWNAKYHVQGKREARKHEQYPVVVGDHNWGDSSVGREKYWQFEHDNLDTGDIVNIMFDRANKQTLYAGVDWRGFEDED